MCHISIQIALSVFAFKRSHHKSLGYFMAISQFLESDSHALVSPWFPMYVQSILSFLCWSDWPAEPWENPVAKRRTFTKHRNNVMTCQPRMENIFCAALFVCRPWGLVGSGKHNSTQPILPQLAFEPMPWAWARVVLLLVNSKKKSFCIPALPKK